MPPNFQKSVTFQVASSIFLVFFSTSYFTFGWINALAKLFGDVGAGNIIGVGGSIGAVCVASLLTILVTARRPLAPSLSWPLLCLFLLQFSTRWVLSSGMRSDSLHFSLVVIAICIVHSMLSSIIVTLECSRAMGISATNFRLFRTFGSLGYAAAAITHEVLAEGSWSILAPLSLLVVLLLRFTVGKEKSSDPAQRFTGENVAGKFVATRPMWLLFGISFLLAFCAAPFQSFGLIELKNQAGGLGWLAVLIAAEIVFLLAFPVSRLGLLLQGTGLIWAAAYWTLSTTSSWGNLGAVLLIAFGCPLQTYVQIELHRCNEKSRWEATAQGMMSVAGSLGGFVCAIFVSTWQTSTTLDVLKGAALMCVIVAPLMAFAASKQRIPR